MSLLAAVLFWGGSFAATKIVLQEFSVPGYMFFRFAAASILFLALLLWRGFPRITGGDHLRLFLVAFFEPGLYFLFETEGLNRTGAADAALIIASAPVVVGVLSRILLGERQSGKTLLGAALSILGVALIVYGSGVHPGSRSSLSGNLLIVGAVVAAALYMITARSLSGRVSTLHITAFQIFYGAIFFAPLYALRAEGMVWEQVTFRSLGALCFLVFGATLIAFLAYNRALKDISAARASVWLNGIPVVAALTAWLLLGERLGWYHLLGGLLVVSGVLYSSGRAKRRAGEQAATLSPGA
jgi:drug/metabolite transporter (DMT)-like permease